MVEGIVTGAEVVSGLTGDDPAGEEAAGVEPTGEEAAGTEAAGIEPAGAEPAGEEAAGADEVRDQTLETVMAVGKTVVEIFVEEAGQLVTSGAQLVIVTSLVLYRVTVEGTATWPSTDAGVVCSGLTGDD